MTNLLSRHRALKRAGLILAGAITLALSGCAGVGELTTPSPAGLSTASAEPTPMFASDEEALAAAERTYRNYIEVSDQISRDGGANASQIAEFVTPEFLGLEIESSAFFRDNQIRSSGTTAVDSFKLQSVETTDKELVIRAYVCLDVSDNRLLDASGIDVTPSGRTDRMPLQLIFEAKSGLAVYLLLSNSEVWTGTNFC